LPQFLPLREQNVALSSGVHPHLLGSGGVPPPHDCPVPVHPWPKLQSVTVRDEPQLSVPVQAPQFLMSRVQNAWLVSAVQPHRLVIPPPPHVSYPEQLPQL